MQRRWALASFGAGFVAWSATAATFLLNLPDHDIAEGFGLFAFLVGLFLLWEGGFTLWRARAGVSQGKPR